MFGDMLAASLEILVYVAVGIVIMMIGYLVIDLVIPCKFSEEIGNNNKAVGWMSAGIYIGLGLIIKSAVATFTVVGEKMSMLVGIVDTFFFSIVGILFFIIGYFVVDIVNKRYKFSEELEKKNEAVGIMVFGIFIGIGLIISGVIL